MCSSLVEKKKHECFCGCFFNNAPDFIQEDKSQFPSSDSNSIFYECLLSVSVNY